ncbi:MAG TPA: dihydrolipoamide acetyltransferase family protein [Vicinamibacterales bacterium]|nr:dihydrolipoamide acetyltransferase family protein [Vicinamibacterales bacterium]
MSEFRMPVLGADMEAGTLVEWRRQPGETVTRGDIIAVVDTDKGAIEIEVFEDGVVDRLVVQPGTKVPVGTVLAVIRSAGGPAPAGVPAAAVAPAPPAPVVRPAPPVPAAPAAAVTPASPAARRRARELGIDLAGVRGTGPGGAVTLDDVVLAGASPAGEPAAAPVDRADGMRRAIAAAMARSKREIPHYYLATPIDVRGATAWLADENARRDVPDRLLLAVLLIKAVALGLRQVPELNGFWTDGAFVPGRGIHVGTAISLRGGGLVAPALHEADGKSLDVLMRELRDVVQRARTGTLRSSELADPTVTISNLGEQGVDEAFGIIYPPQVALVSVGRVVDRPWAADGRIEVRPVLTASLSADHRASDGHRGGLFLAAIDRLLQKPETL